VIVDMFEQFMKYVAAHKPLVIIIFVICFIIAGIVIVENDGLKVGDNFFSFIYELVSGSGQTENAPLVQAAEPQIPPLETEKETLAPITPVETPVETLVETLVETPVETLVNSPAEIITSPSSLYSDRTIMELPTNIPVPTTTIPESDTFTIVIVLMLLLTVLIVPKTRT
jgi:hypothetical protein